MKRLRRRTKNWLFIVSSVALIYTIITVDFEDSYSPKVNKSENTAPSWILKNALIENFNSNGLKVNSLQTETAEHMSTSETTNLNTPVFELIENKQLIWQAKADSGKINKLNQVLLLEENIHIDNKKDNYHLYSDKVVANIEKKQLHTDKAVTIKTSNANITAIGLLASWETQQLNLLNDVHVHLKQN